jgi:hypothetical protein
MFGRLFLFAGSLVSVWCLFQDGTRQTALTSVDFMERFQVPAGKMFKQNYLQAQTLTRNHGFESPLSAIHPPRDGKIRGPLLMQAGAPRPD